MTFTEYAIEVLRRNGYRITRPRKEILAVIGKADRPMSPCEIGKIMERQGRHLDQVTIYRVISLLCSLNLVHRVFSQGGFVKCGLLGEKKEEGCHRFLVCRGCGGLREFRDGALCHLESQIARKWGFHAEHHVVESSGLCEGCYR